MITHDVRVKVLQNARMMRRACRSTAAALVPVMMLSILEVSGASTSAERQGPCPSSSPVARWRPDSAWTSTSRCRWVGPTRRRSSRSRCFTARPRARCWR